MSLEELLERRLVDVETDSDRGMGLGIEIHEQAALAVIGNPRRKGQGGYRLSSATLVRADRKGFGHTDGLNSAYQVFAIS